MRRSPLFPGLQELRKVFSPARINMTIKKYSKFKNILKILIALVSL